MCLFWDLWESPTDEEHVQTYLWLGRSYKDRGRSQDIRACYEIGLLIALHAKNLHSKYKFIHETCCNVPPLKMAPSSMHLGSCIHAH